MDDATPKAAGEQTAPVRLLLVKSEPYPTFRVSILYQFGKHMPSMGVRTSVAAALAHGSAPEDAPWEGGGEAILWPAPRQGRVRRVTGFIASFVKHLLPALPRHDALMVRDLILTGLLGLAACRLTGKAFIYWLSYPFPESDILRADVEGPSLGPVRAFLARLRGHVSGLLLYKVLMPLADHNVVITPQLAEELTRRGLPRDRMTPNPMGVDPGLVRDLDIRPSRDPRLEGKKVIAHLGILSRTRRIDFFLPMLEHVRSRGHDAVLLLVGDGQEPSDAQWIMDQARQMGLGEHVVITGWLPREEAWSYASRADVGIVAFPDDFVFRISSPTKTVELMALGVPVVVSNNPDGQRLLADGGAGLAAPYEPRAFADAVHEILIAPERAAEMGARGRDFILRERDYAKLSAELAECIKDVVRRRRG